MSIFENTVMIKRKTSAGRNFAIYGVAALAVASLIAAVMLNPFLFSIPAIIFIIAWWFIRKGAEIEYEYTYLDGQLDFDRIRAKSRRKAVASVDMEDVLIIAPTGSRDVSNYQRDNSAAKKDCSSGVAGTETYDLVYKTEKGIGIITFEPDQNMLDKICVKYARKVVKKQ